MLFGLVAGLVAVLAVTGVLFSLPKDIALPPSALVVIPSSRSDAVQAAIESCWSEVCETDLGVKILERL
jgi:hypothetical protein